jgi:antitoxin ParD1/3/4
MRGAAQGCEPTSEMVRLGHTSGSKAMAAVEKLSIALTPEFAADVRAAIATGEYASTSEVIRDALRAWKRVREERAAVLSDLRRLWGEGVESGAAAPLDADDIKRRGRERLKSRQAAGA